MSLVPGAEPEKMAGMLSVMSAQIDAALRESEAPAATLVEMAHAMSRATQTIAKGVMDFAGSPTRVFQDLMLLHDDLHARSTQAATAIQFHDRLVQCLTHVSRGLSMLADFASRPNAPSPGDWQNLRAQLRALLSMEAERARFDNKDLGGSRAEPENGTVELF